LLDESISGLTRADITRGVFHQINHHILGLSSRSVSLTRYNLTFRTSRVAAELVVLVTSHHIIPVQDVEEVNVWLNVNSCRVVVAVWSVEK
jgi:hypothetical protein